MIIIDSTQDFNSLAQDCKSSDIVLIPIPSDHSSHPRCSNLTGIYISTLNNMQKYYIPINHSEALMNFDFGKIHSLINNMGDIYVIDYLINKKNINQFIFYSIKEEALDLIDQIFKLLEKDIIDSLDENIFDELEESLYNIL